MSCIFTNEKQQFKIDLNQKQILFIKKFVSMNELDFVTQPSLAFQVTLDEKKCLFFHL